MKNYWLRYIIKMTLLAIAVMLIGVLFTQAMEGRKHNTIQAEIYTGRGK